MFFLPSFLVLFFFKNFIPLLSRVSSLGMQKYHYQSLSASFPLKSSFFFFDSLVQLFSLGNLFLFVLSPLLLLPAAATDVSLILSNVKSQRPQRVTSLPNTSSTDYFTCSSQTGGGGKRECKRETKAETITFANGNFHHFSLDS